MIGLLPDNYQANSPNHFSYAIYSTAYSVQDDYLLLLNYTSGGLVYCYSPLYGVFLRKEHGLGHNSRRNTIIFQGQH